MNELIAVAIGVGIAGCVWLVLALLRAMLRGLLRARLSYVDQTDIVVDGSNVMHWGGDPSVKVLRAIVADLRAQGYRPRMFFDANVGYKLADRHMSEGQVAKRIGVPPSDVTIVPSGEPADPFLLKDAETRSLTVVSDDRFRDWTVAYPWVRKKGRIKRGKWISGAVKWQ